MTAVQPTQDPIAAALEEYVLDLECQATEATCFHGSEVLARQRWTALYARLEKARAALALAQSRR